MNNVVNDCVVSFGDVLQSGRTYDELIAGLCKYLAKGDVKLLVAWLVEEYGFDPDNSEYTDADLQLHWSYYENLDGDYASYAFVTTCRANGLDKDNRDINYNKCIYDKCTSDSDDPGFIGDWNIYLTRKIPVNMRNGVQKCTNLNTMFNDCQMMMLRTMQRLHSKRLCSL